MVIKQKGESQNGCFNVHFSGNLACFDFLKYPFLDSPFCLITDQVLMYIHFFDAVR